jgi:hypothetical protein
LARSVLRDIRVSQEMMRPGDLLYQIGRWKTMSVLPSQAATVANTDKEHLAAMAYRRYQKSLKNAGAVDFDDLLILTEQLFEGFPDVRAAEAGQFDQILVDEYQDTNGSQYRIIRALADQHRNLSDLDTTAPFTLSVETATRLNANESVLVLAGSEVVIGTVLDDMHCKMDALTWWQLKSLTIDMAVDVIT